MPDPIFTGDAALPATGRAIAPMLARGCLKLFADLGFYGLCEVPLPNGRRADLAALGPKGEIWIAEIKSCAADFLTDQKWQDYLPFCDQFCFAVGMDFPQSLLPADCGLIIADGFGGAVIRPPVVAPLAPARRKAMTLRLARLAAARLSLQGAGMEFETSPLH